MVTHIEQKRKDVVEEVKQILTELETATGGKLNYIRSNLHKARDDLDDPAEYNYDVRLALQQIRGYANNNGDDSEYTNIIEKVDYLDERLSQEAALPPQDELRR